MFSTYLMMICAIKNAEQKTIYAKKIPDTNMFMAFGAYK